MTGQVVLIFGASHIGSGRGLRMFLGRCTEVTRRTSGGSGKDDNIVQNVVFIGMDEI